MPPRAKWKRDGTSDSPKPIDIRLEGLPTRDHRLQVTSGVLTKSAYDNRRRAILEAWEMGGMWRDSVVALARKRFTLGAWYDAKQKGTMAVLLAESGAEPLRALVDDFLAQTTARDKAKMRQRLARFVDSLGVNPKVTDLTTANVQAFLSGLTSQRTKSKKVAAQGSTKNRYRAVIQGLCTWAVRVNRLAVHPIAGKKVPKASEPHHRLPELSADEYRDYMSQARSLRPDLAILPLLLLHTAPDVGELWVVQALDVDLERGRIRYARKKVTSSLPRWVPLPSFVVAEVRSHIAEYDLSGEQTLFSMVKRGDLEWLHKQCKTAIKRPALTLKDMRHVAAIAWVRAGVHIRLVQRWLGHKNLSQTMKYTDYEPGQDEYNALAERAAQTLNRTADVLPLRKAL